MGDALTRALAGVLVTVLAVLVLFNAALTAILGGGGGTWACHTNDATTATDLPLDAEQTDIAATILAVARDLDLPERAAIIALAAALQESGLRNLHHGDRDSLGVFQQRPSQGWGTTPASPTDHRTPTQRILDPTHAATEFYRALLAVPGWADLAVTDAAQRVQRSAFPGAYAKWEALATTITHTLAGQRCTDLALAIGAPSQAAATALAYARAQLGLPYQWGGDGPAAGDLGFDCSGLTRAAYAAAGISLPRTAQAQHDAGPRLPIGAAPQPGDLVFYGTSPTHITHVGIVTTPTTMINAPRRGAKIRQEQIWDSVIGFTRPSTQR